tara:strand:- start:39 stop:2087 length:2049 start_codon:yes stop_codon:yes gene_type:complete
MRIIKFEGRDIKVPDDATEAEEIEIIESLASEQNPSVENETPKLNPDGSPNVLGRLTDDLGWAGKTTAKAVGSGLADTGGLAIDAASYIPIPEFMDSQHQNVDELLGEYGASREQRQAARDKFNKENDGTLFNMVRGGTNIISGAAAPFAIGKNLVKASQYFGKAEPYARRLGEAIKTQGMGGKASGTGVSGYANRIAGGGIGGAAATGVIDPEYMAEGAGFGAAFPAVGRVASSLAAGSGKRFNEFQDMIRRPWTKEGREKIAGDTLNLTAGGDDLAVNAANKLSPLPTNDPILNTPISSPTAAMVVKTPAFSALDRSSVTTPRAALETEQRLLANNKARLDAIKNTIPDEDAAIAARTEGTKGLYETAKKMPVTTTPELKRLFNRPSMELALKGAKARAKELDSTFDIDNLTGDSVQHINWALKQMEKPSYWQGADPLKKLDNKLISDTRKNFLDLIERQFDKVTGSPLRIADKAYEKLSLPVGQSRIIKKVLEDSIDDFGNIDMSKFLNGLSDKNAAKVLNRYEIKLQDVLTKEQLNTLKLVGKDLKDLNYKGANIMSGNVTANISNPVTLAGVPNAMRGVSAYNLGLNLARVASKDKFQSIKQEIANTIAKALREPNYAAQLMRSSNKPMKANLLGKILDGMEAGTNMGLRAGARGVPAAFPEYKRDAERSKKKYDLN